MELDAMRTLHLFAGAGGGILADLLLGHRPVCAVEIERFPRSILEQRQRDGHLPWFPIWDDVCSFDGRPWRGLVDVVCGGFPCQDISAAGKGRGLAGDRSGLWFEMLRVIEEVQPRFVFAENSPNLRTRGLGTVVKGLTDLGYDVRWCVLGAWHVMHDTRRRRNRMWLLAHPRSKRLEGVHEAERGVDLQPDPRSLWRVDRRPEPGFHRVAHGLAYPVDRIKAIGNGQVPLVAATAWRLLTCDITEV